ncbi:MAG: hypothetical protein V3T17_11910 [Pseudomonadales bacterium]
MKNLKAIVCIMLLMLVSACAQNEFHEFHEFQKSDVSARSGVKSGARCPRYEPEGKLVRISIYGGTPPPKTANVGQGYHHDVSRTYSIEFNKPGPIIIADTSYKARELPAWLSLNGNELIGTPEVEEVNQEVKIEFYIIFKRGNKEHKFCRFLTINDYTIDV